jgi:hypothetical protein
MVLFFLFYFFFPAEMMRSLNKWGRSSPSSLLRLSSQLRAALPSFQPNRFNTFIRSFSSSSKFSSFWSHSSKSHKQHDYHEEQQESQNNKNSAKSGVNFPFSPLLASALFAAFNNTTTVPSASVVPSVPPTTTTKPVPSFLSFSLQFAFTYV